MSALQIKSKLRVKELAEVYTNEREVNAMLDLVKDYSCDIEKRLFEPACGNGNFLIKILERKLGTVHDLHSNDSLEDYESIETEIKHFEEKIVEMK